MKSETKQFLAYINSIDLAESSNYANRVNTSDVADWLMSLDDIKFSKLISDSFWNKYPSFVYSKRNKSNLNRFGIEISQAFRQLMMFNDGEKNKIITKKSEGFIASCCMTYSHGKMKSDIAKRAISMKDVRTRKRAAAILPVAQLGKALLNESNPSILKIMFNRVGIQNIDFETSIRLIDKLGGGNYSYYKRHLVSSLISNFKRDKIMEFIMNNSSCENKISYHPNAILESVLQNASGSDLLFLMDLISGSTSLPKTVAKKRILGSN
jgi:hypothetical protein